MRSLTRVALSLVVVLAASRAFSFETGFWVWQRNDSPSQSELQELSSAGVRTLYWQLGQVENLDGAWRWKKRFSVPSIPNLDVVPVLRLECRSRTPFTPDATRSLVDLISTAAAGRSALQIDYDCPDRLLLEYAGVLKKIRPFVPSLSITALPGWIRQPALAELGRSVTEMFPMFYDFQPDPVVPGAKPVPVVVPEKAIAWLAEWNRCPTPWRAGVPNFSRLTVFNPDGKSAGHVREWRWDSVCFNDGLGLDRNTDLGVTLFRAKANTRVGNTPVGEKQLLAVRWPDREALAALIVAAGKTSARGLVIFKLPDSTPASGWSLRQLRDLSALPRLVLKSAGDTGALALSNEGNGDLSPDFRAEDMPGYVLQVEAQTPIFREADEGDFWRVRGEVDRDGKARPVMVPLATRLSFFFSYLPAGQTLKSGLIQLAPGANFSQTRYRIVNSPQSPWKSFED
ncbi:MAG: DUF3142 domain-containing protein [Chthoniobacterales bacterium]